MLLLLRLWVRPWVLRLVLRLLWVWLLVKVGLRMRRLWWDPAVVVGLLARWQGCRRVVQPGWVWRHVVLGSGARRWWVGGPVGWGVVVLGVVPIDGVPGAVLWGVPLCGRQQRERW